MQLQGMHMMFKLRPARHYIPPTAKARPTRFAAPLPNRGKTQQPSGID